VTRQYALTDEARQVLVKYTLVAGVDEAGRGPLAGPVVAAAVILDRQHPIAGLADSKVLTVAKRQRLYDEIREHALAWAVAQANVQEIDTLNILGATLLAMRRAVDALGVQAEYVLVDGNKCPDLSCPAAAVVKGDNLVEAISAASIMAKVTRDREMEILAEKYPEYEFAAHKGYPTRVHIEKLRKYGVSPEHRQSFAPVRKLLSNAGL
jgi:ribonuclease HII